MRNPIPQNITPAPVSLYKGKSREKNSPLPAGPSLRTTNLTNVTVAGTSSSMRMNAEAGPSTVRHSESTSAVNTGTSASVRMNAEAGPSTVRHSESTSVNSGASTAAFAEGLHTTAGPSGLRNSENPLASIPEVHLPAGWDRPLSNPIPQHIPSVPVPHQRLPQRLYVTGGYTANPSVDGLNRGHIAHRSRETNFRIEAAQRQATFRQREVQQQADERLRQQQEEEARRAAALETALSLANQRQAVFDELGAQEALRQQQMAEQARMLQNLYDDRSSEQQRRELKQEEQQRRLAQLAEQRQHEISEQQRRELEQEEQQRQHDISEQQRRELEQEEQQRQLLQLAEQRQREEEQMVQRQQEEEAHQVRLEALRLQQLQNEERRRIEDQELGARFLALFQQRERERLEELEYERENRQRFVAEAELQWQQRLQNLSAEELERQLEAEEVERDLYFQSQQEAQQYQEDRAAEQEARQAWEAELAAVAESIQQDIAMAEDEDEDEAPDVPENPIPRRYALPKGRRPYTDPAERHNLGPMNLICSHCRALHFDSEKLSTST